MKLNQEFIRQLRNGEIAAENNGTREQLREVLKEAFPEAVTPCGSGEMYFLDKKNKDDWDVSYTTNLPTVPISDFYEKSDLFTGWAKDYIHPKWMMYFEDDVPKYGFNSPGYWFKGDITECNNYSEDGSARPATHEEIESTLTKEAKRRGYKGGDTIKGIHGTTHWRPEIGSFYYDAESDSLVTDMECVVYEAGQWAEIVEQPKDKPKTNPIHYTVDGTEYSLNYQELKSRYEDISQYSDEQFMEELPKIAHLACVVSYLKGLGVQATISDKGIIHELIHLMTAPNEPTNDLAEIREKFNKLIQLV